MNKWTEYSIEYANQRSYLDDLFAVYPTIPDGICEINVGAGIPYGNNYRVGKTSLDDLFAVYPTIPDGIREINVGIGIPSGMHLSVEKTFIPHSCIPSGMQPIINQLIN
ncbi:MAG: hypothetical protein LBS52_00065 [Dysgonamonadaceae bacterium]|jgi:hypothetical protein|nr:hypothetical protein [Dysgonamonadaceae bacterium]